MHIDTSNWDRIIFHCDLNAYFASVEQVRNPSLRGKPVAVVGGGHRTVITTSSYEARARGVKTGMNVYEAKSKCPELIVVVGDNATYVSTSAEIIEIYRSFTPIVEVFSIDEAWLDVTGSISLFGSAANIAEEIKRQIKERFGLYINIGISHSKLLSKLAGDIGPKPDGLLVIAPEDVDLVLEKLPVDEICGIGSKTAAKLAQLNIHTCGELGRFDQYLLKEAFGINGLKYSNWARGIDNEPVTPDEKAAPIKSVGHSMTLDRDAKTREEMKVALLRLAEMVGRRARKHHLAGKTVSLTVRFSDFNTITRQTTIQVHTNNTEEIYDTACGILEQTLIDQPVRLLGISISKLKETESGDQLSLMNDSKKNDLIKALDKVNDKHGGGTVTFGSILNERGGNKVISPAWRPGARDPHSD